MAQEIERKFLTCSDEWRSLAPGKLYRQGYIYTDDRRRVMIQQCQLTVQVDGRTITAPIPADIAIDLHQLGHRQPYPLNLSHEPTAGGQPVGAELRSTDGLTLRPRIAGDVGIFTIKTRSTGISRSEWEFVIPLVTAAELLDYACDRPLVEKNRHKIPHAGFVWEVDEFLGDNAGLIVAEIELSDESQTFAKPNWIGEEVSGQARYFNSYLVQHPYKTWQ
jgi:adenylate cyclase